MTATSPVDWPCGLPRDERLVMWTVPEDLQPYVSGYSLYVVGETGGEPHRGAFEPAGPSLRISIQGGAGWRVRFASGDWLVPPQVALFGPNSEIIWSESGPGYLIGVGIRPRGWRRLFRDTAKDWADRIGSPPFVHPDAIDRLTERFSALGSDEDVASAFTDVLRESLSPRDEDEQTIASIEAALVDPAITTVAELTERTALGVRTLQRLSDRVFGFSPKVLLRRARFLRSLHAIRAAPPRAWGTAIDPSYTDYSHFIRDAQYFLGMSPQAFLEHDMPLLRRSLLLRETVLGTPAQALDPPPEAAEAR